MVKQAVHSVEKQAGLSQHVLSGGIKCVSASHRWVQPKEVFSLGRLPDASEDSRQVLGRSFENMFWKLTKNSWETRENFNPQPGKYTLTEVVQGVYLTWAKDGDCPEGEYSGQPGCHHGGMVLSTLLACLTPGHPIGSAGWDGL